MKIAVAQINSVLGDFSGNAEKILNFIDRSKADGCDLVLFPELSLFGYHPYDLLESELVVKEQLKSFKAISQKIPKGIAAIFGFVDLNKNKLGRPYFNAAALVQKGKKTQVFYKELLAVGDVFDEGRYIEKGSLKNNFFSFQGKKIFLTICEDIWAWPTPYERNIHAENPLKKIKGRCDLILNLSASPFYKGKLTKRLYMAQKTSEYLKAPMIYCNLVGAQDEVIYDGRSFVLNYKAEVVSVLGSMTEDFASFDLDQISKPNKSSKATPLKKIKAPSENTSMVAEGLILGIRDFVAKNGFKKIHLGLSGGIDSAVVAGLAVKAIGASNVVGIALPGPYSSSLSYDLAAELAKNLGIQFLKLDFNSAYSDLVSSLEKQLGLTGFNVTHENLQARLRGTILMAYSNMTGSLLVTTGNKSEYSTGYSTLYGDMCGGLAPIADLTKKEVYEITAWLNQDKEVVPEGIIHRAPSAELRPNQKDEDSLPKYEYLDKAVQNLVEYSKYNRHAESEVKKIEPWLLNQLFKTEFKRWQAPPILKVSERAFGKGRRYPITQRVKLETAK